MRKAIPHPEYSVYGRTATGRLETRLRCDRTRISRRRESSSKGIGAWYFAPVFRGWCPLHPIPDPVLERRPSVTDEPLKLTRLRFIQNNGGSGGIVGPNLERQRDWKDCYPPSRTKNGAPGPQVSQEVRVMIGVRLGPSAAFNELLEISLLFRVDRRRADIPIEMTLQVTPAERASANRSSYRLSRIQLSISLLRPAPRVSGRGSPSSRILAKPVNGIASSFAPWQRDTSCGRTHTVMTGRLGSRKLRAASMMASGSPSRE